MIPRPTPERFRLRRTMMFMNAQKPGLIKDAYIYGVDSIMLDLEDAVAENQKDAARFSLYHALKTIDYGDTEVIVRINGLDTPHWQEDIRVCVAGGADGIRIAKCESAQDVKIVEEHVEKAEREFGVEVGRTLLMAALESPKGIMNAYEIKTSMSRAKISHIMDAETWMNANKAVELGFADGILAREEPMEEQSANALMYSEAQVVNSLMGRIAEKCHIAPKTEHKTKAEDLFSRLDLIKNWR